MHCTRAFAVALILLSYGAVGARQPAVHTSAPLGAAAESVAAALGLSSADRGHLLIDTIRLVYDAPDGQDPEDARRRATLLSLLTAAGPEAGDTVPLPLDPSVWRDAILERPVTDSRLMATILGSRNTALLYHGLAALDDETLAALGPDRETLQLLLRRSATFAAFGRSVVIRAGRVAVPGGRDAEPLWQALVGAEPSRPGAFVRRLFDNPSGRLAYFFDTLAHLDAARQRFALGPADSPERLDRLRALLGAFEAVAPQWRPDERPFARPALDPAMTLSLLDVGGDGSIAAPASRRLWARVFNGDDGSEVAFSPVAPIELAPGDATVDAAWLISRIHRAPVAVGRRRLAALLFAQRVLADSTASDAAMATILRGYMAFPALLMALESAGETADDILTSAAFRARSFNTIRDTAAQQRALRLFQSSLGLLGRGIERGGVPAGTAHRAVARLLAIEPGDAGYGSRIGRWIREDLLPPDKAPVPSDTAPVEDLETRLIATIAGAIDAHPSPLIRWEGRTYRVNPARAEAERLARIRALQGGPSLDATLLPAPGTSEADADGTLATALASLLYAAHLGEADTRVLGAGDPADRHELGTTGRSELAWQPAVEKLGGARGWRLSGSLLTVREPLARHALRRLDATVMPPEPRISINERHTAELTVALLNPARLTDAARDEIAAALERGRARLASLSADRDEIRRVAEAAGLSEWRREALAWSLSHEPDRAASQLSLVELFWLGAPRQLASGSLDAWGAAVLPLPGCSCLEMPRPRPWEDFAGRPSVGLLSTRGADVALRVAAVLAERRLPATLAPAVTAFAMLDTLDHAAAAHYDDWTGFTDAARRIAPERIEDYVSSLTASGPLFPEPPVADRTSGR